jgi:hypothetical protein
VRCPSTTYKYSFKRTWLRPTSLHDHGLQVHLLTHMIRASKLAPLQPPTVCPNSDDFGLQVDLQTHSITASKCISQLARSRPPIHLQTHTITDSNFEWSWLPTISSNLLDHALGGCLYVYSITASKCISKYSWLPRASGSGNSLEYGLGVFRWVHSIVIFRRTLNCSQASPAASLDISCVDGLLYISIDTLIHSYIDENTI